MQIIEKFVQGKSKDTELCEDGIVVSDHFVAVVDGATAKSTRLFDGVKSGKFAMQVICRSIPKIPKKATGVAAINFLTRALAKEYKRLGIYRELQKNPNERPTAAVIIYSKYQQELWMIEDCQAMVDGLEVNNFKRIDALLADVRSCIIQMELLSGKTIAQLQKNDVGREFVTNIINRQGIFQNMKEKSEFSFWAMDGFEIPKKEVKIVNVTKAKEIVLASDGYPSLKGTLKKSENALKKILAEDPMCYTINKQTKGLVAGNLSYDDRAYVRFKI